jgi:hypothetical protein
MGKYVLGISRSECASHIFINACNEFLFLESVSKSDSKPARVQKVKGADEGTLRIEGAEGLNGQILRIISEQSDSDGYLYAAELKNILLRLHPDFSERNYGQQSFGKLLAMLEKEYEDFHIINDNYSVKLSVRGSEAEAATLTAENWTAAFSDALLAFKDEGFDRVDPSILKAAITGKYPGFDEKQLGFKKFSDLLKYLEKYKYVKIESNFDKNILVRIL